MVAGLGLVVLGACGVVAAGWDGGAVPTPERPGATPSPSSRAVPSMSAVGARVMVRAAVLRGSDLPARFAAGAVHRAGSLAGRPSLDLCGASLPSERFRLARHRVSFATADGRTRIRQEVVVYRHGYVDRALAELRAEAPLCSRPVPPEPVQQPGALALRVVVVGAPSAARNAGRPRHEVLVERRGDVLSVVHVEGPRSPLTLEVARTVGRRLVALQPDS